MKKDLIGLGGRAFFSYTDRRAKSFKKYKLLLPGLHGISDIWRAPNYGKFVVHRSLGRVQRMSSWKSRSRGWKIPPWTVPTSFWIDDGGLWLGCVDYKLGKCRMPLQGGKLGAPTAYSDGPLKTIWSKAKKLAEQRTTR